MSATDPITRLNAALEGRYRIEREIGESGMAVVYLAEDLRHERKVAFSLARVQKSMGMSMGTGRLRKWWIQMLRACGRPDQTSTKQ